MDKKVTEEESSDRKDHGEEQKIEEKSEKSQQTSKKNETQQPIEGPIENQVMFQMQAANISQNVKNQTIKALIEDDDNDTASIGTEIDEEALFLQNVDGDPVPEDHPQQQSTQSTEEPKKVSLFRKYLMKISNAILPIHSWL